MMMKRKILIIDDDDLLANSLADFFNQHDFYVVTASDGKTGLSKYKSENPDIILLDLDLPDFNGFEISEQIHEYDYSFPIIIMSGSWTIDDYKIKSYELGAMQFLVKPTSPKVILAQIKSIFNRPGKESVVNIGSVTYTLSNQVLISGDKKVELREREAQILAAIFESKQYFVTRKDLQKKIWHHTEVYNNKSIDSIVYSLNKRIECFPELKIKSLYSKGYKLDV
jgi:DNA-binding response OmpR family regulator